MISWIVVNANKLSSSWATNLDNWLNQSLQQFANMNFCKLYHFILVIPDQLGLHLL